MIQDVGIDSRKTQSSSRPEARFRLGRLLHLVVHTRLHRDH